MRGVLYPDGPNPFHNWADAVLGSVAAGQSISRQILFITGLMHVEGLPALSPSVRYTLYFLSYIDPTVIEGLSRNPQEASLLDGLALYDLVF